MVKKEIIADIILLSIFSKELHNLPYKYKPAFYSKTTMCAYVLCVLCVKKNFNNRTCPKLIGPTIDFLKITAKPNNTH